MSIAWLVTERRLLSAFKAAIKLLITLCISFLRS